MRTRVQNLLAAVLLLPVLNNPFASAHAQGTAFTYQGRVTDNGTNFSGAGQFKFALVTSTNFNHQAAATATRSGQFITIINVTSGGSGYANAPAVTISGGGGSGATAHSTLTGDAVTSITVDNPGSGYTSTPTVIIAPPPPNISYTTFWSNDGTSVAGSEPSGAVNVAVSNGLFTVVLGDMTQPGMTAIDASIFAQPNLQLRIWFNDGVHGSAALSPVQNLTPTPYAISAGSANSLPSLLIIQNTNGAPNIIGGSPNNFVSSGVVGATIAGGGSTNSTDFYPPAATNRVTADFGTVSGGGQNTVSGKFATVGGGANNTASGDGATVPGGSANTASGIASFAAGSNARATNDGAFVWADESTATNLGYAIPPFFSTTHNEFSVRAAGGVRFVTGIDGDGNPNAGVSLAAGGTAWSTLSDRNAKKNFAPINGESVLEKLAAIPVEQWNYKWEPDTSTPHIGPMAQDFKAAFYPGRDDKSITTLEFDGVELAAIQGLNEKMEVRSQNSEVRIQKLETETKQKDTEIQNLKQRLEALEKIILNQKSN